MKAAKLLQWLTFPATTLIMAATAVLATPKPAHAYFEVCNATSETVWTAIGYNSGGQWWAEGWWRLSSGECATLIGGALDQRYYYIHAHTSGRSAIWEDNYSFCTSDQEFTLPDQSPCDGRVDQFFQVDTEDYTDFTQDLCPPGGCASGSGGDDGFNLDTFASSTTANSIRYVRPRRR